MSLDRKLEVWVAARLIDASQAAAIRAYEAKAGGGRPWAAYGVAGVGVTAVVTGVISVVAANWDAIPAAVKLISYLLVHAAAGAAWLRQARRPGLLRETLLTVFAWLFLPGIGLVAQIYNLHGDGWTAILFWLGLSLPGVLLAESRLIGHMWFAGLATATVIWLSDSHGQEENMRVLWSLTLAFAVTAAGLWRSPGAALPPRLRAAAKQWGWAAVLGVFGTAAAFAWAGEMLSFKVPREMVVLPWLGVLLAVATLWLSRPAYARRLQWSLTALLIGCGLYTTLPTLLRIEHHDLLGAALHIALWGTAGAVAVFAGRRRLFDVIAFVIAARFVVVYFEVFGSLAATGLGLILSGLVILSVAFAWHRYRGLLAGWLGGRA